MRTSHSDQISFYCEPVLPFELFDELQRLGKGEPLDLRRHQNLDHISPVLELGGDGIEDRFLEVLERGDAAEDDVVRAVQGHECRVAAYLAHGQKIEKALRSPSTADQRCRDAL